MTDFYLGSDLTLSSSTNSLDANTAGFSSPTVGSTRSIERLGDRLRFQVVFAPVVDTVASNLRMRGRLQSLLTKLRGQAGRLYVTPPGGHLIRGSFPVSELIANNTFVNGAASWTVYDATVGVLAAQDRSLRVKRIKPGIYSGVYQMATTVSGVPYCARAFVTPGRGAGAANYSMQISDQIILNVATDANGTTGAYLIGSIVPLNSTSRHLIFDQAATGGIADDYFDVVYSSLTRCAQVDNSQNLLLFSDQFDNGAWAKTACTITPNAFAAPDGTTTADGLVDNGTNTTHLVSQAAVVPAATADFSCSVVMEASAKNWCFLKMVTATGTASVYVNLTGGVLGTVTAGTGWSNARATITSRGPNRYRVHLTAYKTSADTSISFGAGPAAADLTPAYAGATTTAITLWRGGMEQSSLFGDAAQSTAAAVAAIPQTGLSLALKGLPASTSGLLLPGDWIECGGQLNQIVAPLDSDAAGMGFAQLMRPPRNSPADDEPFIVHKPMGKFMLSSNSAAWTENPGPFSEASIELVEDISF